MASYWVFGASKPLGIGLTKALTMASHAVTCFSRTPPISETEGASFVSLDFRDVLATRQVIAERLMIDYPDGAVFCQRYRSDAGQTEIEAMKSGLDVELAPVLALTDAIKAANKSKSFSLVLVSSVAGLATHNDLPLHYHLLKAVTVSAARTLASHGASSGLRANCIVLGEFEKYPRESYSESEQTKFECLEKYALSNRICTIKDICNVIAFLLSAGAGHMTGQLIQLDGGVSGLAPEYLVRDMLTRSC
jgi:NAD(P)-dependent dehydrogenase (short-subunit alcohol dehydrogenase family)